MKPTIIDVREVNEYATGHVVGSLNIPLSQIPASSQIANLPRSATIVVYCRSGNRSALAKQLLENAGFTNVVNGINEQAVRQKYRL